MKDFADLLQKTICKLNPIYFGLIILSINRN